MVLLIMAAGSGSRYGSLKQFDELGPKGEFLMEYSIYDAIRNDFTKIVLVTKKKNQEFLYNYMRSRIHKSIDIAKSMAGLQDVDVDVIEYPQNGTPSSFSKENKNAQQQSKLIFDLLPENIQKELNKLNVIPLLYDEKIYFMMPHSIEIN